MKTGLALAALAALPAFAAAQQSAWGQCTYMRPKGFNIEHNN